MGKSKRYEKIQHLGEGQFAMVYKAKDTLNNTIVAIKKIKIGSRHEAKDGINRTALREIKLLRELDHKNVIGLLDVIGHKHNISLVIDFMGTDLEHLIKNSDIVFLPSHIKNFMAQTLCGLEYLHKNWILHRDLKPNNLLLNDEGVLKLADFGLARFFGSPNRVYTHQVVTRWYRAPELLMGARSYGTGIDLFAIGCILAELLLRVPLFPGESDLDQLSKICDVMGTPKEQDWPNIKFLPDFVQMKPCEGTPFQHIFTAAGNDLLSLLKSCLMFNPMARCDSTQALHFPYFTNEPKPAKNSELPIPNRNAAKTGLAGKRRRELEDDEGGSRKRLAF